MDSVSNMMIIPIVVAGVCLFLLVVTYFAGKAKYAGLNRKKDEEIRILRERFDLVDSERIQLLEERKVLDRRCELLEPFSKVADADKEAARLVQVAKAASESILSDATDQAEQQQQLANAELAVAREKAKEIREKAQLEMDKKIEQGDLIIETARAQAVEIAGSALEAKEKAELWEAASKAARNIIKGYGDEYIVPSASVLDDLAEEFSHKDAGIELKKARAYTKELIKQGQGATCLYVEAHRKETAIRFVLDAYNGKVDSVLSSVKHNNFGKLQQQIEDAYILVNYNGSAFRDASVTDLYHKARLSELKWAVAASELQMLEREEQRAIREQMREEERARKEYEKAIRTAEKEEELLQKALDKARKELAGAAEEQKAKFEAELLMLQEKLTEAELKNQRALSMAQQTRRGHVYVISNIGSFGEDVFKVGMTRRLEPLDRVRELGDASVPFSFDIHAMIYSEDAPALEKELHRKFASGQMNKVNARKEFFRVTLIDIKQTVEEMGVDAHWTMKADAAEYYETLAIEKALLDEVPLSASQS